jgi:hypothetical protein
VTNIPDSLANFDWVSERAKCTPFTIFEVLRSQVEQDVNRRNALSVQLPAHKTFIFQANGEWFAAVYQNYGMSRGVKFRVSQNGITVRDVESNALLYEGILIISNDGQCRLRVDQGANQAECDLWQFRKLALHDLFFVNQEVVP